MEGITWLLFQNMHADIFFSLEEVYIVLTVCYQFIRVYRQGHLGCFIDCCNNLLHSRDLIDICFLVTG